MNLSVSMIATKDTNCRAGQLCKQDSGNFLPVATAKDDMRTGQESTPACYSRPRQNLADAERHKRL